MTSNSYEQRNDEIANDLDHPAPPSSDLTPLYVHPDEKIVDVVRALALGGFRVYSVLSSGGSGIGKPYLCVAQPWRVEAEKQRREEARARAQMTPEELAAADAAACRESRITEERSRS